MGLVLAAGSGERFQASGGDRPKVLSVVRGQALVAHVLAAVCAAGLDEVAIVEASDDLHDVVPAGVTRLRNPRPAEGIASSLRLGVAAARAGGHDAVVVALGDQPGVTVDAGNALARQPADPPIAVATYAGVRGTPVCIHASVWDLLPSTGDEGAWALMRARPDLVWEVPCTGEPDDVDTVQDLDRLRCRRAF